MKTFSILVLFAIFQGGVFAQTPTPEAIALTASQLLGTTTEQEAAVTALIEIGVPSMPHVAAYLTDKDVSVKAAAWRVLNGVGFDTVVSSYIAQLSSDNAAARLQATKVLSAATSKYFGYTADNADTAKRSAIVTKWTAWLASYRGSQITP